MGGFEEERGATAEKDAGEEARNERRKNTVLIWDSGSVLRVVLGCPGQQRSVCLQLTGPVPIKLSGERSQSLLSPLTGSHKLVTLVWFE